MAAYWERYTQSKVTRKRFLVTSGALSAGAALLAACGSGGTKDNTTPGSALLTPPDDSTNQAKTGGTLIRNISNNPVSLDVLSGNSFSSHWDAGDWVYPRLLKHVPIKYPEPVPADQPVTGDLAEAYEWNGDKTQVTMKLRRGLKWDLKSGREIDAEDVVFSWTKFDRVSSYRGFLSRGGSADAPVSSITAADKYTVLIKLANPDPGLLPLLATNNLLVIMPRESDMPASQGGFDPKGELRGYGPWLFESFQPSVSLSFRKNPDYYVKGRPFFDKLEFRVISEYATRLAQFRAGQILLPIANDTDKLPMKRELPQLTLQIGADGYDLSTGQALRFGYENNSPFADQRVRQAFAMSLDKATYADVLRNKSVYEAEGIDLQLRQPTAIGSGWEGMWLDPTDSKVFGPDSKYLQFNVAEAKRLMAAAGHANGVETKFMFQAPGGNTLASVVQQWGAETGFKITQDPQNQEGYLNKIVGAYALFENHGENAIYTGGNAVYPDIGTSLTNTYRAGSRGFYGMTTTGRNPEKGDPEVEAAVTKIKTEFDSDRREKLVQDFQRMMAVKAYMVSSDPGQSPGLNLFWPALRNYGTFRGLSWGPTRPQTSWLNWWIDTTKPPFTSA